MENGLMFGNRILDLAFIAWAIAQGCKVVTELVTTRRVTLATIWRSGGMPSSHSSSVTALATSVAMLKGFGSVEFAITAIFSAIVMYDAAGIRRAAGKQAEIINKIVEKIRSAQHINLTGTQEEKLKELLGHTPFEVVVGAILGIVVAYVFRGYIL